MIYNNIAFIVGCPRSGTSILGETISKSHNIIYEFEKHDFWKKYELDDTHLFNENKLFKDSQEIETFYDIKTKLYVEKNPRHMFRLIELSKLFHNSIYLHIVRHPLDTICSLKAGLTNGWNHAKPLLWKHYDKLDVYKKSMYLWLECQKQWEYFEKYNKPENIMTVRYEDFIKNDKSLIDISTFLYPYIDGATFRFYENYVSNNTNGYHANHQKQWFINNHTQRIGRWKDNLPVKQINEILRNDEIQYFMNKYNYTMD